MGNKVNDEMKQNFAIDTETITRVKASSVASGPFVTHCREDLVKPLRHPTPLRHVHPWDIDGNDDANEYRRFNLGGTVNFWFVNRGLTLLLKAVPLRAILVSWAKSSMLIELQTTLRKRFAIYFSVCTFFMFASRCQPFPRANSLSKWSKIFIE